MNHFFFFLTFFFFLPSGTAQNAFESRDKTASELFLVPYNDNDKWGWCDTLGNIVLKPKYAETGFFFKQYDTYIAEVKTEYGQNLVNNKGKLLFSKTYHIEKKWNLRVDKTHKGYYIICSEKRKKGFYDPDMDEYIIPVQYDSIVVVQGWGRPSEKPLVFAKKSNEPFIQLNLKKTEIVKTDFSEINIYRGNDYRPIVVAKTLNSEFVEIRQDPVMLTKEEYKLLMEEVHRPTFSQGFSVIVDLEEEDFNYIFHGKGGRDPEKLEVFDYSGYKNKYGFSKLFVVRKDSLLGVVSDLNKIVIPVEYDKLIFDLDKTEVTLYKNGKLGKKLLFTSYPRIETKYDEISRFKNLRVSGNWFFQVFKIKLNGQTGYVGENGVEYFNF